MPRGKGALHHQQEVVRIDRLRQKIERALLHSRDRILNAAKSGHHDHRKLGVQLLCDAEHAETVPVGQPQVRQHERGMHCLEHLGGLGLVPRLYDGVALRFEGQAQHRPKRILVLDEQDGGIGRVPSA